MLGGGGDGYLKSLYSYCVDFLKSFPNTLQKQGKGNGPMSSALGHSIPV